MTPPTAPTTSSLCGTSSRRLGTTQHHTSRARAPPSSYPGTSCPPCPPPTLSERRPHLLDVRRLRDRRAPGHQQEHLTQQEVDARATTIRREASERCPHTLGGHRVEQHRRSARRGHLHTPQSQTSSRADSRQLSQCPISSAVSRWTSPRTRSRDVTSRPHPRTSLKASASWNIGR
jgi:hypothetical protein